MDREIETTINRLMSDLKAAQDLSDYLAANNKKLRETLKLISEIMTHTFWSKDDVENIVRDALKEGE